MEWVVRGTSSIGYKHNATGATVVSLTVIRIVMRVSPVLSTEKGDKAVGFFSSSWGKRTPVLSVTRLNHSPTQTIAKDTNGNQINATHQWAPVSQASIHCRGSTIPRVNTTRSSDAMERRHWHSLWHSKRGTPMKVILILGLVTNVVSIWSALYWRERYWDAEETRMYLRRLDSKNVK